MHKILRVVTSEHVYVLERREPVEHLRPVHTPHDVVCCRTAMRQVDVRRRVVSERDFIVIFRLNCRLAVWINSP